MHEKYIVRHIELPTIISRPRERTLRMGPPRRRRGRDLSTHQRGPCYRSLDSRLWFLLAFLTQASVRKIRTPSRSVAQSGSAPRSGRGGRRFKSCHSDQLILSQFNDLLFQSYCAGAQGRQLWRQIEQNSGRPFPNRNRRPHGNWKAAAKQHKKQTATSI
jgi:hypothetical protein